MALISGLSVEEFTATDGGERAMLGDSSSNPAAGEVRPEDIEPAVMGLKPHFPRPSGRWLGDYRKPEAKQRRTERKSESI